jgi:hypothetical protein
VANGRGSDLRLSPCMILEDGNEARPKKIAQTDRTNPASEFLR